MVIRKCNDQLALKISSITFIFIITFFVFRVLSRAQMEAPDTLKEQRALAARICSELAQQAEDTRDYEKAIRLYKEAAGLDDTDGKVCYQITMSQMSDLHMMQKLRYSVFSFFF